MDARRLAVLRRSVRPGEGLLITQTATLRALTGTPVDGYWLLVTRNCITGYTSRMMAAAVREALPRIPVHVGERLLPTLVAHRGQTRTVIVDGDVPLSLYRALRRSFRVKIGAAADRIRLVKTPSEIIALRKACRIAAQVVQGALRLLKPGVTEIAIARWIAAAYLRHGVVESFATIVAFDEHTAYPHHIPGGKQYQRGSVAMIDTGCKVDGMCSDITRMYVPAGMSQVGSIVQTVQGLQQELVAMCRPGVAVAAIDRRARTFCREQGWAEQYLHSTGHGVGYDIHEAPRISGTDTTVLSPGMTVTIEPGVYFDGSFGVRIEDTVLVTKHGPEILTAS